MRRFMLLLLTFGILWTIMLIHSTESEAQTKKAEVQKSITELSTNGSWFEFIYGGDSRENTGLRILVHDGQRQYVAMSNARMFDKSVNSDPKNYWVKLIAVPEINPLAFKQAETMEENARPEDGITVLIVRFKDLQEAQLKWFQ